jgi:undecaprenyl diphosphate synthase
MDGNGRWAENKRMPRLAGHRAGTENIRSIIEESAKLGIQHLTLFAFSTENWRRPSSEVEGIMGILKNVINSETFSLHQQGVKILHIGSLQGLSQELKEAISYATELTRNNKALCLNIAFNYGGRAEILEATKKMLTDNVSVQDLDEKTFSSYLDTAGIPDPDLIIRTGGEMRLSNFLIWQSAYSEYYSTTKFWPDFKKNDLRKALDTYKRRDRRFGEITTG